MDAESTQETLKIFNFTTTYAILIKLTKNIYLNKLFHLAKSWGVIHRVQEGLKKKTHKMRQKNPVFWSNFYHFTFQKNLSLLLNWKPFKNDEKSFLFHLKSFFVLKISKFLQRLFGHVRITAWLERSG